MRGWQDQASNLYASVLRVAFIPARVRSEIIDFELSQNIGNLTHGAARRRRRIDCLGERMEFHATGGAQIVAFGFGGIAGDIPVVGKR